MPAATTPRIAQRAATGTAPANVGRAGAQARDGYSVQALSRRVSEAVQTLGTELARDSANSRLRADLEGGRLSLPDYRQALVRVVFRMLFLLAAEERGALAQARSVLGGLDPLPARTLPGAVRPESALAMPGLVQSLILSGRDGGDGRDSACFGDLRVAQFGAVYETLLARAPAYDSATGRFSLGSVRSQDRRRNGSYFTPDAIVAALLDKALDPLLDAACESSDPLRALLSLKVCDPACGSGNFLVAAARRIAGRLASVDQRRPSPLRSSPWLIHAVSRCIYGVDLDPVAVDLTRMSLWSDLFDQLDPGAPLPPLGGRVKVGDALLGAFPDVLVAGLPDAAFRAMPGDEEDVAEELRRRNRAERRVPRSGRHPAPASRSLAPASRSLAPASRLLADAWCAAFVWPKRRDLASPPTTATLDRLAGGEAPPPETAAMIAAHADGYRFFHWHLEFPEVFAPQRSPAGGRAPASPGGFDCVLGNPPWIAHGGRAAQALPERTRTLLGFLNPAFAGYRSTHGMFVRRSAELLRPGGRLGLVVPTSIADLKGYAPTRRAHDELAAVVEPVANFGDGAFAGVFQPCMALVSVAAGQRRASRGGVWEVERQDLSTRERSLIARFASWQRLPAHLFGEAGLQTSAATRALLQALPGSPGQTLPIREGKDIREFCVLPPRLHVDPRKVRCDWDRQRRAAMLVRQTARFPIAAPNDRGGFRNSLLAVFPTDEWPAELLLAILNSSFVRWLHYQRFRDAREGMPQVKVEHLRRIPAPLLPDGRLRERLVRLASRCTELGVDDGMRTELDEHVAAAYDLSDDELTLVLRWRDGLAGRRGEPVMR